MEVKHRLPIDPETQAPNGDVDRVGGQAYTVEVFADCPYERSATPRPLGRITIRPGLVPPGHIAAVRAPDGSLQLGRIYYERAEGGREFVRLEDPLPGVPPLRYPLADVTIEGAVIHVSKEGEQ
jgi:hypothetical protein